MNKYFWALERMIAEAKFPGWYPTFTVLELMEDFITEKDSEQELHCETSR